MRALPCLLLLSVAAPVARPQRGGKQTARDLFYSEAGLIVSHEARRGKFGAAKKSVVAVTLGLKYRIQKLVNDKPAEWDPAGPWAAGDSIRLAVEINDAGYLYIVHRRPNGAWRRVFPTPEIERGSHFVRAGVTYAIPPEEGLELPFAAGQERLVVVLAREPLRELEALVGPLAAENTVSALPPPEVPDGPLDQVRNLMNPKDLLVERAAGEKSVYLVNRSGRADSLIVHEIRLASR